jgi:hypothetical protein
VKSEAKGSTIGAGPEGALRTEYARSAEASPISRTPDDSPFLLFLAMQSQLFRLAIARLQRVELVMVVAVLALVLIVYIVSRL